MHLCYKVTSSVMKECYTHPAIFKHCYMLYDYCGGCQCAVTRAVVGTMYDDWDSWDTWDSECSGGLIRWEMVCIGITSEAKGWYYLKESIARDAGKSKGTAYSHLTGSLQNEIKSAIIFSVS